VFGRADDWGLEASAFELPQLTAGATPDGLGEAEAKLTLVALKYARHARGGRVNPRSLSRIWDQDPPIRDPNEVMTALAGREEAHSYLRALHPQHEQFKRLREVLLKARGPAAPVAEQDPALQIKLPKGATIKPGAEHADIATLRLRLKVPAEAGAKDTLLDPKLVDAVTAFQKEKGLEARGWLTQATRNALNSEGEAKRPNPTRDVQRIIVNMERWRWMPEDMGQFHVWSNSPEFAVRVFKDSQQIYKEKIIVGQPTWPTPVFSADMLYVMFYPSWGMPAGIKAKELLPRIRSSGGGFFGLFGGGSSVIEAYDLKVYYNGRQIDPGSVDWNSVNIQNYSFIQPPGPKNPLGVVKFRFPNKHDVYMHDTPERELFARGSRALSHGCIRVNNPMRFAEILIEHDRGPGNGASRGDVTLKKPIPVHITYFTAIADESGHVSTFGDIYGHDSRLSMALGGKSLPYDAPAVEDAVASSEAGDGPAPANNRRTKKKQPESVQDLISNVFLN
jgi:murein L,D-transpeptidase YcbB/YkuD